MTDYNTKRKGVVAIVYVKLIREEVNKTTCELLNIENDNLQGVGIDRIVVSESWSPYPYSGITLTREDFEFLYERKNQQNK